MSSQAPSEDQIDQKELAPGVLLTKEYKKIENDPNSPGVVGIFTFKVQVKTMNVVEFEVFLDQSENIELENREGDQLKTKNNILPFETKTVAKVILKDDWKLKSKFKLTMGVPEKAVQDKYVQKDEERLRKEIEDFRSEFVNVPFEHLNVDEINNLLSKSSKKFIDLNFVPSDDAVINERYDESIKNYLEYVIHWRRPGEFVTAEKDNECNFKVFNSEKDPEPNDIRQGLIPCNHLDSALSALAEKYNLIKRLFRYELYNENGIYQVKLCINGEWITVVVDDLFPCIPMSPPLVTRCQSNELWILIIEKALAKIYDCYYNLTCINIADFFQILTGCPTVFFSVEDLIRSEERNVLFNKLKEYVVDRKFLTVAISRMNFNENNEAIEENENSLTVPNFGYTVVDVKTKYNPNLIVLRKVWFDEKTEQNVENYLTHFMQEYPAVISEITDTTLLLTYEDFLKEFSSFAVCMAKNWDEIRIRGKFVNLEKGEKRRVLSKNYYTASLEKQTNLVVSLFQDEDKFRDESRKQLMDISLTVIKYSQEKNEITHVQTYDFSLTSQIQMELNLPAGQYIILPRSSGCFFGKPAFPLEKNKPLPNNNTILYDIETRKFSAVFISTVKDIFKKFDLLLNRLLGYKEFKGFWECAQPSSPNNEPVILTEEEFSEILSKFQSYNKSLTEEGFIQFFEDSFLKKDGEETVKSWFKNLGYDDDLYPLRSRCFMLTFHSDSPISVSVKDAINTDLALKVDKLILKAYGEKIKTKKDISVIQYQSKTSNVMSIGALNEGTVSYRVVLSFKENEGVLFSGGVGKVEKIIQPGKYEAFLHLFSFIEEGNKTIDFNIEYYALGN